MRIATLGLGALLCICAATAQARDDTLASKTLDELKACKSVAADATRLACYDRASSLILAARESGDLLALDRKKVVENKRRAFGLAGQEDRPLGGGSVDREIVVTSLDSTIESVSSVISGRYHLVLADKTVWETTEPLMLVPRAGSPIHLKRASLGGYRASITGGRSVLVKRIR
jgi:hypothetical protein